MAQPAITSTFTIGGSWPSTAEAAFAQWAGIPVGRVLTYVLDSTGEGCVGAAFGQAVASAHSLCQISLTNAQSYSTDQACTAAASTIASTFSTIGDAICCTSIYDGPLALVGRASSCAEYVQRLQDVCDAIDSCPDSQTTASGRRRTRRLSEAAAPPPSPTAPIVTLVVLTQGMSDAQVAELLANLQALLASPADFMALFGVPLATLNQPPVMVEVTAPPLSDEGLGDVDEALGTGGGDDNAWWMGPVFGLMGPLCGCIGFLAWRQSKQSPDTAKLMGPEIGVTGVPSSSLAKASVRRGHAAGSEMVAVGGNTQLSAAI